MVDVDTERRALEVEAALCVVHWVGAGSGSVCGAWRRGDGGAVYDRSLVTCLNCISAMQCQQAVADGDLVR